MSKYVLGIDQSTQGTKALLFDEIGNLIGRVDISHEQIVNNIGWVEHNPIEIYENTIKAVKNLIHKIGIKTEEIVSVGISNQRETALIWNRKTGKPIYNAIVWQCARGEAICKEIAAKGKSELVKQHTGIPLSPYFSAAKIAWILQNVEGTDEKAKKGELCAGTMDSWLVYKLTGGQEFKTDYSNASRTQMFNIRTLQWDKEVCDLFSIPTACLGEVCDSNAEYGTTNFEGLFSKKIPIQAVLGDSHGALFGQGCHKQGMIKATYGTGSSIMMNIGNEPIFSSNGVVTSLAWGMDGAVNYVLEGNINYTGAVITWLQKDVSLITSAAETEELARQANQEDTTYLVPAFSGLGAPYWDSDATAVICGMTRMTGKAEIVKAGLECIAYQIADIIHVMKDTANIRIQQVRVDGGSTKNKYLMQFQSDMLQIPVQVPNAEELSGIGAAYMAGIKNGIYHMETIFSDMERTCFIPQMEEAQRKKKYDGWKLAVKKVLTKLE